MKLNGTEHILLLTSAGAGDFTKNIGIVNSIKKHYPDTTIDVLALHGIIRDLARYNSNIHDVILIKFGAFTLRNYVRYFFWKGIADIIALHKKKYDIILCPQINPLRLYLMFFLCKPKKIIQWDLVHDVRKEYGVLEKIGIKAFSSGPLLNSSCYIENTNAIPGPRKGRNEKKTVCISMFCADSPNSIRDWDGWDDLIELLEKEGYRIILIGQVNFDYKRYYPLNYDAVTDLVNKTGSIDELVTVIRQSSVVVAVDSFHFHLSYALGVGVIGLFGPVDPEWRIPPGIDRKRISLLYTRVPCSPCLIWAHRTQCANAAKPRQCMNSIGVADVVSSICTHVK